MRRRAAPAAPDRAVPPARFATASAALLLATTMSTALLLGAPPPAALAQDGGGGNPHPPAISQVKVPTYAVGDRWVYVVTQVGRGAGNATSTEQVIEVETLESWGGVPAYRLRTTSEAFAPPAPEDPTQVATHDTSDQATWMTRDGLAILRTERVAVRNQSGPLFTFLRIVEENWTFHPPRDDYQFPILGPGATGEGDAWVIVANATIHRNTTFVTHTQNQTQHSEPQPSNDTVHQVSRSWWLRTQRIETLAGPVDTVVVQTRSGNATILDFWAPQAGNLARREILNETGRLVQTAVLKEFTFQNPPAPPGAPQGRQGALTGAWPYLGAAVVGVGAALAGAAWWRRRGGDGTG